MKKILVIGAGFLQDFVIRKAKTMGYYTLAVDADPNAIGFAHADKFAVINIIDEEACLKFAQEESVDGVLTAATDYGVLTASYIADNMGIPGLNYASAKLIKNKYLVRKCLFENQVDDTEQTFEIDKDTDVLSLSKKLKYPVMVKPCDGSGSRGASRVDSANMLVSACEYAMASSLTNRAEIESFVVGKEYGAEALVVNGEIRVLGIMKKFMTSPPYYAELGHSMPCGLSIEIENKVRTCVENAIRALEINHGSVNMDILITANGGIHIVDVGARMGGNMIGPCIIPYGTGIDYVGNMISVAVGDLPDWTSVPQKAVATKLLAFKGGVVRELPDFCELEKSYGVEIYHHLEKGQVVNEYHTNLDGCGYIVARDSTPEKAEQKANMALKVIEKVLF